MSTLVTLLISALTVLVLIPSIVLFIEVMSAYFSSTGIAEFNNDPLPARIAVLVPAHNESTAMVPTLLDISRQLNSDSVLVVVADNCSDDTPAVALAHGATVVTRSDTSRRGKGFALAFGLDYLASVEPCVVIVIDADCRVSAGTIQRLAAACVTWNRPVQALDLMKSPKGYEHRFAVAEFAWIVRNKVRPLGLANLSLPCQLMGTGMAFPWEIIRGVNLASSSAVEDLELGIALASKGFAPRFLVNALVESHFPTTDEGVTSQRQRWEQGSLSMLLSKGWKTLGGALRHPNLPLLVLALDMLVPPLAVHAAALLFVCLIAIGAYLVDWAGVFPIVVGGLSACLFIAALLISWLGFGRDALPLARWRSLGPYFFAKFKIYRGFGRHGPKEWVRSDRTTKK